MNNPHLMRSRGLAKRKHVADMNRVNPTSANMLDNRAAGIARLVAVHLLIMTSKPTYLLMKENRVRQFLLVIMLIKLGTALTVMLMLSPDHLLNAEDADASNFYITHSIK